MPSPHDTFLTDLTDAHYPRLMQGALDISLQLRIQGRRIMRVNKVESQQYLRELMTLGGELVRNFSRRG